MLRVDSTFVRQQSVTVRIRVFMKKQHFLHPRVLPDCRRLKSHPLCMLPGSFNIRDLQRQGDAGLPAAFPRRTRLVGDAQSRFIG